MSQSESGTGTREQEVEALRKQVSELQRREDERDRGRSARGRRWAAVAFLVLACVIAPLAATSVWLRNQVTNTDRYVRTVTPLASNAAIQSAVSTAVTNELFSRVNVAAEARQALPPRADFLAVPLASGVRTATQDTAQRFVASDRFQALWVRVNRVAHAQLVRVLTGNNEGVVQSQNGQVVLDLTPIVNRVKTALDARGVNVFDKVDAGRIPSSFVLLDSASLAKAQRGTEILKRLAIVLPLLFAAFLASAIAVSPRRRRTVLQGGLGVALSMLVLGLGLTAGRSIYLDYATGASLPHDAAAAFYDIVVHWLRVGLRAIAAIALLVAAVAFLAGPSRPAVAVRRAFDRAVASLRGDAEEGPLAPWVAQNKTILRIAAVGIPAIVFFAWSMPSPTVLLVLAVVAVVLLLVVEILGRSPSGEPPPESAPTS